MSKLPIIFKSSGRLLILEFWRLIRVFLRVLPSDTFPCINDFSGDTISDFVFWGFL